MEELVPVCILRLLEQLESESTCAAAHGVVLISIMEPERTLALCVFHSFVYNRNFENQESYYSLCNCFEQRWQRDSSH